MLSFLTTKLSIPHREMISRGHSSDLAARVRQGIVFGLLIACVYAAYAVGLYAFRGARPFERIGTSLPAVVATYLAGGVVAGGVVGALLPLARYLVGMVIVAVIGTFGVMIGITLTSTGFRDWRDWQDTASVSILLGTLIALILWAGRRKADP